ncbi:MAG: hypothetical protein A3G41_03085 [Elusimicrobia bacterium RIFCSPLOWO2_12_FULL_59_9]|nr:MAG: hypothetical protein A3G41_03085 [Elusimicrobia bacterium RIFCSPLOWO2_12_FULL_59_9]
MKGFVRMFLAGVWLVALSGAAAAEPLEKLAGKLGKGLGDQENKKVAVLDFPYPGGGLSSGSSIVQERLTTFLVESGKVEVIERSLLRKVLEEMRLESTGVIDSETTKELGKVLGVGALVTGTLNDLGRGKTEINARVIQADTGKILSAGRAKIDRTWSDSPVKSPGAKPEAAAPHQAPPALPSSLGSDQGTANSFLGKPLVQLAVLLDTSNSMDGLISQAKTQIWKIVNELASSERDGASPVIQVALYEYGNDNLSAGERYIRQVLPFTADLDQVSEKLFALTTRGGEEFAGAVIKDAAGSLEWDKHADVYKAIFIAGNEPFTQGPVDFREAVASAVGKGVVVNTIFCGSRQEGVSTQWKAGADAGGGDYLAIEQGIRFAAIEAPQDAEIQRLGAELNKTYIPYGARGREAYQRQEAQDKNAASFGLAAGAVAAERAVFKAKAQYAAAASWDLVGEEESGRLKVGDLKKEDLPADLRSMKSAELASYIRKKAQERKEVQKNIDRLSNARARHIAQAERKAGHGGKATLDQAMLKAIRAQASKKNLKFKSGS